MKTRLALLVFVVCGALAALGQTSDSKPNYEQNFAPGGHLKLDLTAGDYTIRGTDESKIRVFVTARDPDKLKDVKFTTATARSNGKLKISGPHNNIQYVVELPKRLDVTIRLSAGDLEVSGL